MKPIFFVHNQKCGGTSFAAALRDCSINYIPTSSINLDLTNHESIRAASCKPGTIIVGHPSHVKYKSTESAYDFFQHIYSNYKLIFPVRRPSRVILSWVFYYNTRIRKSLDNKYGTASDYRKPYTSLLKYDKKLLGFAAHLSYSTGIKLLNHHQFGINENNVTDVLIEFLKYCAFHVRGASSHSPALNFTRNLTLPIKEFNTSIQNSMPIPPAAINKLINTLDICIFNSDKLYSCSNEHPIYDYFGDNFIEKLKCTRKNLSQYPNGTVPQYNIKKVDSFYENLYPSEYLIFNHAI